MAKVYPMPETECINCGHRLNYAGDTADSRSPEPGDITVCMYCGHIQAYAHDLQLRELMDCETEGIAGSPEVQQAVADSKEFREWLKEHPDGEYS